MMSKRILLVLSAAALALLAVPAPATASHSLGYHWARTANPFTVELDDNVTATWDTYLRIASDDWSASSVLDAPVRQGSFGSRNGCTPSNGHVEICNASYGNTGWLTITSFTITDGVHIVKASIKLNDTYLSQAPYSSAAWRQALMCQNIGRTLGLSYQDSDATNPNLGSCMDLTNDPDGPPSNEHPNQHDYDELVAIYTHADGYSTTGASPAMTVSTHTRDLGHGLTQVSVVTWA
jgi:hypothetical protein